MSGNKLIIPPTAKFGGKTLEQLSKEPFKVEKKQQNPISRKNVQAEGITILDYYEKGKTQKEAVEEANRQGLALVSNTWADEDLNKHDGYNKRTVTVGTGQGASEKKVYAIWTGTLIAYKKPGDDLGGEITCVDSDTTEKYVISVPLQFQNEKDCALVVPHFILEDGTPNIKYHAMQGNAGHIDYQIKITDESSIQLISDFPAKNGWYLPEASCGIPVGSGADSGNDAARYLYRATSSDYVGLVARGVDDDDGLRDVGAGVQPSDRLGVLAQQTE